MSSDPAKPTGWHRAHKVKVGSCFLVHAASSISLTLLNKYLSGAIASQPFAVLLLQNAGGALLLLFGVAGGLQMESVHASHLKLLALPAACFVGVLATSLLALGQVSVPLVVVVRNATPLATLLLEALLLNFAKPTLRRAAALSMTLFGACLYSTEELSWTAFGLGFLMANAFLSALMGILEARMARALTQSAVGLIIYRFVASLPLLLGLSVVFDEKPLDWPHRLVETKSAGAALVVTSVLSTTFGLAVMNLTKLGVPPTTILAANSCYKLMTTVLGIYFYPVNVPFGAWIGYFLAFSGFVIYALQPKPKAN